MIRKFKETDTDRIMQIWLNGNKDAHPFIPEAYWQSNFQMVQEQLSQAELFLYEADGEIQGFIGIMDHYIAGIFVENRHRSAGIGAQLLEYAKSSRPTLSLNVYKKNKRAVDFYLREGFLIRAESTDEETGCREYTMCWDAE